MKAKVAILLMYGSHDMRHTVFRRLTVINVTPQDLGHHKRQEKWRKERIWEETNKRERERKKKVFRFSLRSTEIKPWVFVEARGKAGLRNEGYAWVPKSWSFVKLHEIESFSTWIISSLKVI